MKPGSLPQTGGAKGIRSQQMQRRIFALCADRWYKQTAPQLQGHHTMKISSFLLLALALVVSSLPVSAQTSCNPKLEHCR